MTAKKTKATAADELDTTEDQYMALKPKPDWKWISDQGKNKDQWLTDKVHEGEGCRARIHKLADKMFTCYRDGRYLGAEETLELAQMRCAIGTVSEKNRVMRLWEQKHPDELPPFLQLTDEERKEYWRRNPPTNKAKPAMAPPKGAGPGGAHRAALVEDAGGTAKGAGRRAVAPAGRFKSGGGDVVRVVAGAKPLGKAGTKWWQRQEAVLASDGKTVTEVNDKDAIKHMVAKGQITLEG